MPNDTMAKRIRTLHRKLKIGQHQPHKKKGMNQGAPEEVAVQYCYISKILQGKITIVPQGVQITWSEKISRPSKPSSHDL